MISPVRFIQLSDGCNYMIVDNRDYADLRQRSWSMTGGGYATTTVGKKSVYAHRLLMNPPPRMAVDHKNGNKLDNRRSNLRIATVGQNNANGKDRKRASRFRGVVPTKEGTWAAQTLYKGRKVRRTFEREEDAARQYDEWAKDSFGEFARLNFG